MSSKKQKLEALLKSEDWGGFYEEFQKESDRACAIVGAAFLDEHLRQLIVEFLVDDDKEVEKLVDQTGGGLSSFSSRISAAYCLGLISKKHKNDLNIIRKIRNDFAHRLHGISFEDQRISSQCQNLESAADLMDIIDSEFSSKERFNFTVIQLANWIKLHALSAEKQRRAVRSHPKLKEVIR